MAATTVQTVTGVRASLPLSKVESVRKVGGFQRASFSHLSSRAQRVNSLSALRAWAPRLACRSVKTDGQVVMSAKSQDELKKEAAWKAVEYVKSGMVVGLGTGSTAAFAVDRLADLLDSGELKDIIAVPTSIRTYEQAKGRGIPLATLDEQPKLDVAIDGADEVDPNLDVVKGRGGALLREKMVEMASEKFVCIVDDSKLVDGLGGSKLAMPVEIVQFCWKYNLERIANLPEVAGCQAKLRMEGDKPYVTDNSNYIVDLYFEDPIKDAKAAAAAIIGLEGVVDHGLFLDMVDVCIIASSEGVILKERN
uniref:ribose-5-phosphate isomerase n=1 Tax=Tetraselmis sp. GSL018 TaxID=582737 RepID=A0A061R317_9CHLO|mmetsp:Transcript_910/g.2177  ORF Transcript_910/g.2177 Transcript_910/m.2177 type:complete len:308 (-) Transcript_910:351-1274(-)